MHALDVKDMYFIVRKTYIRIPARQIQETYVNFRYKVHINANLWLEVLTTVAPSMSFNYLQKAIA